MKEAKKRGVMLRVVVIVLLLIIVAALWANTTIDSFYAFRNGTVINGVDCSNLTPTEVQAKINDLIYGKVTFTVYAVDENGKSYPKLYAMESTNLGLGVADATLLQDALNKQRGEMSWQEILLIAPKRIYNKFFASDDVVPEDELDKIYIENLITVDRNRIMAYLNAIPELSETTMKLPEDAYIDLAGNFLRIVPEKEGNMVDLEQAANLIEADLLNGEYEIDFSSITDMTPDVNSSDENLNSTVAQINNYLKTAVTIQFTDGSEMTLDANTMKDWLEIVEGQYSFDVDGHLPFFLFDIQNKVNQLNTTVTLKVGSGEVTIDVPENKRARFNYDAENEVIRKLIFSEDPDKTYVITPEYVGSKNLIGNLSTYIALSIDKQTVWAYSDGVNILEADVVTGNVRNNHSTPTGIYYLSYKTTDATLRGYNDDGSKYASDVKYWMPFNGGIGFHDASWRYGNFGGQIYKTNGSHGCVNMRLADAKTLYEFIDESVPIFVF